jgi:hypothetical protein
VNEIAADRYEDERKTREIAVNEAGLDEAWIIKRLKYLTDAPPCESPKPIAFWSYLKNGLLHPGDRILLQPA